MIEVKIPGAGEYRLEHLVLDVNGTLACDGHILDGVEPRLAELRKRLRLHLVTSDTYGRQEKIDRRLSLKAHLMMSSDHAKEKVDYIRALGAQSVIAIGNGANDSLMLEEAVLGILVIGREGAALEALTKARVVVTDINDALDLLLQPLRLVATLRK